MANICLRRILINMRPNLLAFREPFARTANVQNMSSLGNDEVILKQEGNKGVIILSRPSKLNAINLNMIRKIYPQLRKWDIDNDMKLVIIKSNFEKAFCSGGDIKDIVVSAKKGNLNLGIDFFREEFRLNNQIASMTIPYVALLDGIVMGGGVGLSIYGAYRVATEKAIFAMPETLIGYFTDIGASHFLPRLPGKLGLYLALTGARLTGRDLFKAGIATHFVCSERLEHLEKDLLRMESPDLKRVDSLLTKYQEQWEGEHKKEFSLKPYIGRINSAFGAESVENIFENLEKDHSEWAVQQLETLNKMSPTSLKVTFKAIQLGSTMSLPDCLKMEYKIAANMIASHDFYEGVRALLIDKDRNPKWEPSKLSDITNEYVNSFFKPPNIQGFKELQL